MKTETRTSSSFDVEKIRLDFPALHQEVHGKPLVYLDNAATSQKPRAVIDAITHFYERDCANVHRGVHTLSMRATESYEGAREKLKRFLNASSRKEIVFLRGTTEALNLVAQSWARPRLKPGDEIVLSRLEHHSNIVPWQILCEQTGAVLKVVPLNEHGEFELEAYRELLGERTRLVSVAHVSNALGSILPLEQIVADAHRVGAKVAVDGAQAVPHGPVDVQALDVDFYCISSHKMYGPTGIGCLYAKQELLEAMPPYQGGGDMIASVRFEGTTYNELPYKFEAGTPNIAGVIGFGAAVDYLASIDFAAAIEHENSLLEHATDLVGSLPGVRILGTAEHKVSVLSWVMQSAHPHDVGTILDQEGIAVRTGHHCAQPVMERFGVPATVRASFGIYNTHGELEALARGLEQVRKVFS